MDIYESYDISELGSHIHMMLKSDEANSMVTYIPNPIDTSDIELSPITLELVELIAEQVHETWAANRAAEGWVYGEEKNERLKTTPCMVPYSELPESEKLYDRATAMETLKMTIKLGYKITKRTEPEIPA